MPGPNTSLTPAENHASTQNVFSSGMLPDNLSTPSAVSSLTRVSNSPGQPQPPGGTSSHFSLLSEPPAVSLPPLSQYYPEPAPLPPPEEYHEATAHKRFRFSVHPAAIKLRAALQGQKHEDQLDIIKTTMAHYPELPAGERGTISAELRFNMKRQYCHSAEKTAKAFGISRSLHYEKVLALMPIPPLMEKWVNDYTTQHHPGSQPASLQHSEKIQLARDYFNGNRLTFNSPLCQLATLLNINPHSLQRGVNQQRQAETGQLSADSEESDGSQSTNDAPQNRRNERPIYQVKLMNLRGILTRQLAQAHPGKTMEDLTEAERRQLAFNYWQEQPIKPSLQILADATLIAKHILVRDTEHIRVVPDNLQDWIDKRLLLLSPQDREGLDRNRELRMELALDFCDQIPPAYFAKKCEIARAMDVKYSSLTSNYWRRHRVPAAVEKRVNQALEQRRAALQQTCLSEEEIAQTAAALWLKLSGQVAEKALACKLNVDYELFHNTVCRLRAQAREAENTARLRAAASSPRRRKKPSSVIPGQKRGPFITIKKTVNSILASRGIETIQALIPKTGKKTSSNKPVQPLQQEAQHPVKLERVTVPQGDEVPLVLYDAQGKELTSVPSAVPPLAQRYTLNNQLIFPDPTNSAKSLTLQIEGVETAQQLQVSNWGALSTRPFRKNKLLLQRIVEQARNLVAQEGPALAAWIEGLAVCHESFAEDDSGALVSLGIGVFNGSGGDLPPGTLLGPVAGVSYSDEEAWSLMRKQGSKNSLSHTWNSTSRERVTNSFDHRNVLAMVNSGKLPGKSKVANFNVGTFTLGDTIIFYFTTHRVPAGGEFFIRYGRRYNPETLIEDDIRRERVESAIARVLGQQEVKQEPDATESPAQQQQVTRYPFSAALINSIFNRQGWQESRCEALAPLLSYTCAFQQRKAVLVIVNHQFKFIVAIDSVSHETVMPHNLSGRKLAVIQHVSYSGEGPADHYHAVLPRAGRDNVRLFTLNSSPNASLEYTSCERVAIPPTGFCLTHASWVALTGQRDDETQGALLREQLRDVIQTGEHEALIKQHTLLTR